MKAMSFVLKWFPAVFVVFLLLAFAGCVSAPSGREAARAGMDAAPYAADVAAAEASSPASSSRMAAPPSGQRPGLGTEWGETRVSTVSDTRFERRGGNRPAGTARLFYNDEWGLARMMRNESGKRRVYGQREAAGGLLTWGIEGESGSLLPMYEAGGQLFVEGEKGSRYSIVAKNATDRRIEVVFSVDGLDVFDGRPASYAKRGYILGPKQKIEVDGFRKSSSEVAAFRFSSVQNSYAELKHGDTRNVGVIGVAVFQEEFSYATPYPDYYPTDRERRMGADPFPRRYSEAP